MPAYARSEEKDGDNREGKHEVNHGDRCEQEVGYGADERCEACLEGTRELQVGERDNDVGEQDEAVGCTHLGEGEGCGCG